jgi:hypothetical protein
MCAQIVKICQRIMEHFSHLGIQVLDTLRLPACLPASVRVITDERLRGMFPRLQYIHVRMGSEHMQMR